LGVNDAHNCSFKTGSTIESHKKNMFVVRRET